MFDVYAKPNDYYRAVDNGFNILAFLLTFLWLVAKRMYLFALIHACLAFILWTIFGGDNYWYISVALSLIIGFYANSIWAWHLRQKGYEKFATIEADSKTGAIQKCLQQLREP
jgi:hypothetical protein